MCRTNYQIKHLDNLPCGLIELNCSDNKFTQLDNLPNTLITLFCSFTKLKQLNNIPNSLKILHCDFNPFIYDFKPTLENIREYNISSY